MPYDVIYGKGHRTIIYSKLTLLLYFNTEEVQNAKKMKKRPGKNAATDNTIYISWNMCY